MAEKIWKLFFHSKRNLVLHQRADKPFRLLVRPQKKGCIRKILPGFQTFFKSGQRSDILPVDFDTPGRGPALLFRLAWKDPF